MNTQTPVLYITIKEEPQKYQCLLKNYNSFSGQNLTKLKEYILFTRHNSFEGFSNMSSNEYITLTWKR